MITPEVIKQTKNDGSYLQWTFNQQIPLKITARFDQHTPQSRSEKYEKREKIESEVYLCVVYSNGAREPTNTPVKVKDKIENRNAEQKR